MHTLDNGLRVIFKHSETTDGVKIRLIAKGGYSELGLDWPSGALSSHIAKEAVKWQFAADESLHSLFLNSVHIEVATKPFFRMIEGSADSKNLELLFARVSRFFRPLDFSKKAFQSALEKKITKKMKKTPSQYRIFKRAFLEVNMGGFEPVFSLSIQGLKKADRTLAERFFSRAFSNPSEFICVIVGDMPIDVMKRAMERQFANVTAREGSLQLQSVPTFAQKNVRKNVFFFHSGRDRLCRLTFEIKQKLSLEDYLTFELICQILQERMTKKASELLKENIVVSAYMEFPFYPCMDRFWVAIQFSAKSFHVSTIEQLLLAQLADLKNQGPSSQEVASAQAYLTQRKTLRRNLDDFWLEMLVNFASNEWNLHLLDQNGVKSIEEASIKTHIRKLACYTVVSGQ